MEAVENETEEKEAVSSVTYKSLFRFASLQDKIFIFLAVVLSLASGCVLPLNTLLFSSLLEDMVKYGLNIITGDEFMKAVGNFAIYNSVLGVIIVALSYLATVFMNYAAINQIYKIRQEYLKAALNQDFEYYDVNQTGDFASKMSDEVQKLEDGIGEKLTIFIYYQASFVSCVVMALVKGWKLALLCLVSFPVTLTLVGLTGFIASRLSKQYAVISGNAGSLAEEVFSSIRTVYAFSGQNLEIARYDEFLKQMRIINIKKALYSGLAIGFLFLCIFCTYALSFWFGYQLIESEPETYSIDTMMAVFLGVIQGSASFGVSTTMMDVFGSARGAGSHIYNLIEKVPKINPLLDRGDKPETISGEIEFKNVTFSYPSRPDIQILNGVTIYVKRGHSIALVGPSGCGKSTIIQLISRCYDIFEGSIKIDGNDIGELSVNWLRSHIGLVGQEPVLFNTTVRRNIRYGREDASDADIEAAAKSANAHHFIMKLPKGYDTLVGERGASLSGGQKQRIAIARALVRNPEILLLDEATSALDTESEAKVQEALDKAQEGRTTIIVAHRLSTIKNVDQILVFKNGQIIESGTHEELMENKEQYYNMVMIQVVSGSESAEERSALVSAAPSASIDLEEVVERQPLEAKDAAIEESQISFWNIVSLNKPEWIPVTIASICSIISGFAMPLVGIVIGDFIGALSNPNKDEVLESIRSIAIIFVIIGAITGVMNFAQVFNYGIAGEYLTQRLRRLLFKKLLSFEMSFFDNKDNSTGALCAKLSGEAASVQGATGQRIGTVLQAMGTFGFGLVLSLIYEWRIALLVLAFVPIIAIVLREQSEMTYTESNESVKAIEASSKIAVDAVSNVRTVASLGREKTFLQEYAKELYPTVVVAKRSSHWKGVVFGLSSGLFNFVYAASMYFGGFLIVDQGVPYEVIYKAIQAILMGATSATQALAFAPNFQKGLKAAKRILMLLKRPSKITDPDKPAIENFIGSGEASVQDVGFSYPTRKSVKVLKNFSLDIDRGKTIALVGPSGCGKSTIIQLLERYYDPDSGVVTQDRISLKDQRLVDIRRTVGIVSQEPILFDRTIGENIAYGDNSRIIKMDEVIDAAKQANIHNFIVSLHAGYDTNIGSKGVQLSGGQKQRIAIARALVRQPKMLLLDEATSALDTENEKVVQEALDKAKAGRTCVIIAHRLSTVQDADQICVLNQGRLAEIGTHSELMAIKGLYYNLSRRGH